jgi:poly(3-hydroxybutyrate) depolymerase
MGKDIIMFRKVFLLFTLFITVLILNNCVSTGKSSEVVAIPYNSGTGGDGIQSGKYSVKVHGTKRDFVLTLPENYDKTGSYPLVLAWHGLGGTAEIVASGGGIFIKEPYFGLLEASENQAIFIAGQGLVGPGPPGMKANTGWGNRNGRDIAFVKSLIDWAELNLPIDKSRIFSIGFSYGGGFTNLIACRLGNRIRAIASISGHLKFRDIKNPSKQCRREQVAAWFAHAQNDRYVAYKSGAEVRDLFMDVNECGETYRELPQDGCVRINDCADGYPVVWCSHQRGHTVPDYTGKEAWDFFSQF